MNGRHDPQGGAGRFQQADDTITRRFGGSGLGLAEPKGVHTPIVMLTANVLPEHVAARPPAAALAGALEGRS